MEDAVRRLERLRRGDFEKSMVPVRAEPAEPAESEMPVAARTAATAPSAAGTPDGGATYAGQALRDPSWHANSRAKTLDGQEVLDPSWHTRSTLARTVDRQLVAADRAPTTAISERVLGRRAFGAILVESGRLQAKDLARIEEKQRASGLRFGQAAVALGLIRLSDVDFALSRQFDYPLLEPGDETIAPDVVTAFTAQTDAVAQIRALRSQLILKWLQPDENRHAIAFVSGEPRAGKSFTVANLAVAFAQLGRLTLVIDADLQRPTQHALFRIPNRIGLSSALAGLSGSESVVPIRALPRLHLLPAGPTPPNPHDMLSRPAMAQLLLQTTQRYDVVLIDTPPWNEGNGASMLSAEAGAAVLMVRSGHTLTESSVRVAQDLAEHRATLLGVVLNQN